MKYRNRSLLNLAHRVEECMNCGRYSPGCEPAHQNGLESGKGIATKGQDHRHAALCHDCHAWLDQGGTKVDPSMRYSPTWEDKREMWTRAHLRTFDHYWSNGWLEVSR